VTLPDPDLLALRDDIAVLEDIAILRPLTLWRAWHREAPRTSQLSALQLVAIHRVLFVFGGNRTGKTELMRAVLVAIVLGSDHPDARDFWLAHAVDPNAFPRGPGKGWIVALRAADSVTYHRQQVLALIPKWGPQHPDAPAGQNWHTWHMMSKDEARLQVMCPGYAEPAEILFKSDDPGPDTMQGDSCRVILHDEETRKHGSATWEEAGIRLIDQRGWHLMSNTPTRGRTWLWHEHVRQRQEGEHCTWMWAEDNPYLPPSELKKLAKDPQKAAFRLRGEFVALEGRAWPQFTRATHVVPPFRIPEGSFLATACDFGTRSPFAWLWMAILKHRVVLPDGRILPDGAHVVYREHYKREWTLDQHVKVIREVETAAGEHIDVRWCDHEDPQLMLQLAHTHGFEVYKARKAIKAGINAVGERLNLQDDGMPGLFIVETCENTIAEAEMYVQGEGDEVPKGQSDHTCDCLRYLEMGILAM